jgi:hypothetical protein
MTVEDVRKWVDTFDTVLPGNGHHLETTIKFAFLHEVLESIASDPTRQDAHLLAQEALRVFE